MTERKLLAFAQRRFGPAIAGRNGWLQVVVDLLKLASKESFILSNPLTALCPPLIVLLFSVQVIFLQNFIFFPSGTLFRNIDAMILFHLILVMGSNLLLIIIGFLCQSKYSLIGVIRSAVHIISMDIFITVIYVILVLHASSGNFFDFAFCQGTYINFVLFAPFSGLFMIITLLEAKRAPFDHVETESEVVAGYATEFSGVFLLTFYLVEYFHLIISSVHASVIFLGAFSWCNPLSLISITFSASLYPIFFW